MRHPPQRARARAGAVGRADASSADRGRDRAIGGGGRVHCFAARAGAGDDGDRPRRERPAAYRYRLDTALKEISFGLWEGLTWPEIEARDAKGLAARRKDKWSFAPPGGESYAMLAERLRPWLDELTGDAFVVSHGGVARALMALVARVAPPKAVNAPIAQAARCASRTGVVIGSCESASILVGISDRVLSLGVWFRTLPLTLTSLPSCN